MYDKNSHILWGLELASELLMNLSQIILVEKSRSHRANRPGLQMAEILKERGRDWNEFWNFGRGGRDLAGQNSWKSDILKGQFILPGEGEKGNIQDEAGGCFEEARLIRRESKEKA